MTTNERTPSIVERFVGTLSRFRAGYRSATFRTIEPKLKEIATPNGVLRFALSSEIEEWRATSLLSKEAGTVAWIGRSVHAGDIFYDIGANIGIYSLMAAQRVGETGKVYSFEPHLLNCASLLRNIASNNFVNRITPLCVALHADEQLLPFNYYSLVPGASMSQLNRLEDGDNRPFDAAAVELKQATSIDRLIASGHLQPPTYVKIDVDGNEPLILSGMKNLLASAQAPREVQVEVNAGCVALIEEIMRDSAYDRIERHDTAAGLEQLRRGTPPEAVAHNLIYRRSMQHPATAGKNHE